MDNVNKRPRNLKRTAKLLIATAISPKPCKTRIGDYLNFQSFSNKLKYANLKNYETALSNEQVDNEMNGPWNKVALIKDLLAERQNEWIMWIDADVLIVNMSFDIPFDKYKDYNLVIWGEENLVYNRPDPHHGINSGVFLIRICDWSIKFIEIVGSFGKDNGKIKEKILETSLNNYSWYLFEQNAFCYVLKYHKEFRSKTLFENSYSLNGYWKVQLYDPYSIPFIVHFCGCQFCSGAHPESLNTCLEKWNYFRRISIDNYEKIKL